ncbi:WD40/YVTN repeat-like-containing domain superfamily [Sesbania bispinosa]|nr:WD40/YVTN repeat-like-containing domain superfamily [Sesbania bispinosa]
MSSLSRELVFLILQFLEEEKLEDTVHKLEQESGFFFNIKYFEEKTLAGEWDEAEKYLSSFTKVDDNQYSMKVFFEIRKLKNDKTKAVEILVNDLKVFSTFNEDLYKEITHLLTLDNFRENERLSKYGDAKSARNIMLVELKKLIEANPLIREKLIFPPFEGSSRLRSMINQRIFHFLLSFNFAQPFTLAPTATNVNAFAGWMVNANPSTSAQSPAVAASSLSCLPNQVSILKHSRTPNALGMMDYQNYDHDQLMTRLRSAQYVEEVTYPAPSQQAPWWQDFLPRTVVCTLHQGSTVTSMDFNPSYHSLLAVGCANGELSLWEIGLRERLISNPFKIWNISSCSALFQATIVKDSSISVNRVSWSPDENFIGVAFTKHLIHLYSYQAPNDLQQCLEIDAHVGGVNDLAFLYPNKQLCIVTCGDDKLIKVWDLTGQKLFNFEGHGAPVYSVCPHQKENIQFIFSTAVDGKIKAWLYDNLGSRLDYDAPGQWCTTMLYNTDGSRLFSCGTSKDGDHFLVEWNEREGAIKRRYSGFRKKSVGIMQFDTTKSHFLAAGEDNQIKFWHMDNTNVLTSTDAEGDLPVSSPCSFHLLMHFFRALFDMVDALCQSLPRLKFNKEANLLAVTTKDSGLKILANSDGIKYLRAIEARSYEASKAPVVTKNGVDSMARSLEKKKSLDDVFDKSKALELKEIVDPVQCQIATMPDGIGGPTNKVARLLYTNYGCGLLALGSKGIQKLWKWSRNELNPWGKATASVVPKHWQPNIGLLMTNDVRDNSEAVVPCITLSKNDSYVMSACGGRISLFNTMTFEVIATFMPPPPSSTFLAFHPQDNNIVAIGMEDSTIHIYNVSVNELFFWSIGSWDKKKSLSIQIPAGYAHVGDTYVQFHIDQVNLLVCHETQLAIYDASKMELIRQWVPQDGLSCSISSATYSCNSKLVYAAFTDGNVGVFEADSLRLRCRIASSAYLHQTSSISQNVYPLAVTAHPEEPNQFAIGLSDGSTKVIEPTKSEGRWGN